MDAGFDDDQSDEIPTEELIELVEDQRNLLIAIATGTGINPELDREYKRRRRRIDAQLQARSIKSPLRWPDLRQFWAAVAAPTMTTYQERRSYIHGLVSPLIERLETGRAGSSIDDWGQTNEGWADLDRRIDGLRRELADAEALDDWQDVGRRAREIILDLVDLVYDAEMSPAGQELPKQGDAKTRLSQYLAVRIPGNQNAELRNLAKGAWDLANKVVHGRVDHRHAFAAAQGAVLLVRTVAVIEADYDRGSD